MKNEDELRGKSEELKGKTKQAGVIWLTTSNSATKGWKTRPLVMSSRLSGVAAARLERRLKTSATTSSG